jgi:nicotinamidase-related amidase
MKEYSLSKDEAVLVIIDIQERLAAVMSERERVTGNCVHLIEISKLLHIPVVLTEQYPKGLGPTVSEIKTALPDYQPVEKIAFSCCGQPAFLDRLSVSGRKKVIVCGMETHICVLQSCVDLIEKGFTVHVASDAQCSRAKENHKTGIQFMRDAGRSSPPRKQFSSSSWKGPALRNSKRSPGGYDSGPPFSS